MLQVGQVILQQLGNFGRRLEALGRVLGVQLVDDRDQPVGDLGIGLADRLGVSSQTRLSTAMLESARNGGRPVHIA